MPRKTTICLPRFYAIFLFFKGQNACYGYNKFLEKSQDFKKYKKSLNFNLGLTIF